MIRSQAAHETGFADRVLVVESDPDLCERLAYSLEVAGCTVHLAESGRAGLAEAEGFAPDVVLLDFALPDVPGAEVCRLLRAGQATPRHPAIVVLADTDVEIDRALEEDLRGAVDGYVVKPLSVPDVVRRVDAILRARVPPSPPPVVERAPRRRYVVGRLEVDLDAYQVFVDGGKVPVAAMEMRLLVDLAEHLGLARPRDVLLKEVWGYAPGVCTRTLDTHVKSLRAKLGDAGSLIQTVRGMGYRLSDELR